MPLVINKNLDIQGRQSDQKQPLDWRYGPWDSVASAVWWLNDTSENNDKTYYGLTIGIKVYDDIDSTKVIGVDEYWWQPSSVWDGEQYVDGFIRKYPANTHATLPGKDDDPDTGQILGISSTENDYNTEWRPDNAEQQWNELGSSRGDTHEVVDSVEP